MAHTFQQTTTNHNTQLSVETITNSLIEIRSTVSAEHCRPTQTNTL